MNSIVQRRKHSLLILDNHVCESECASCVKVPRHFQWKDKVGGPLKKMESGVREKSQKDLWEKKTTFGNKGWEDKNVVKCNLGKVKP